MPAPLPFAQDPALMLPAWRHLRAGGLPGPTSVSTGVSVIRPIPNQAARATSTGSACGAGVRVMK